MLFRARWTAIPPYTIWGMKEPDYGMSMMVTGGSLNEDENCRLTTRTWTEKGEKKKVSGISFLFTGTSGIAMPLTTTTIFGTGCHHWRIRG
jgi:hypothetical protein